MKKTLIYKLHPDDFDRIINRGVDLDAAPVIPVEFDFDKKAITVGTTRLRVEDDYEYTYKVLKTKIKAMDGIEGLYKWIKKASDPDALFHGQAYALLLTIFKRRATQ